MPNWAVIPMSEGIPAMQITDIKKGTRVSNDIRTDSFLELSGGVAQYLASDDAYGHALLHVMPADGHNYEALEKTTQFQSETLHNEVRCGKFEDALFFSEPFPLGEFMFEWLERRERVAIAEAIKRIIKLLHVLHKAHEKKIFHGHITPKTVLMQRTSDTFELRIMGLGVAQALPKEEQLNIDWFDYKFDLEGMTPKAVDIYGTAIVLMGLVSGERGIDNFEETGLLPSVFRNGILQQAMERALTLRIDTYVDVLTFTQDLEAALLEIDAKEGEVYVGDLVGYESAVKSLASISEEHHAISENSGVWSSLVSTLEQEERSSLLYSLTSLTSIKPVEKDDDDEEDITCISTIPQSVLGMRRIKSSHTSSDVVAFADEKTHVSKTEFPTADGDSPNEKTTPSSPISQTDENPQPRSSKDKLAEIQDLESQIETDDDEEDDAPTRVVQRPNYISIRIPSTEHDTESLQNIDDASSPERAAPAEISPIEAMKERVNKATVVEHIGDIKSDAHYDDDASEDAVDSESDASQTEKNHTAASSIQTSADDAARSKSQHGCRQPSASDKSLDEMTASARQLKAANDALRKNTVVLKKAVVGLLVVIILLLVAFALTKR